MERVKTKALESIERKMENVEKDSIRYRILECAKSFKASWLDLGQALYTVWKDKLYKGWGYVTFEAYTAKEIGIRKETALKLLKSYYFLEKEEPAYLGKARSDSTRPTAVPSLESVNALRLAKGRREVDEDSYTNLKRGVFEGAKEAHEVRRDVTALIRQREDASPDEARAKRRITSLKRLLSVLKSLKRDLEISNLISVSTIREVTHLIDTVESELVSVGPSRPGTPHSME